MIPSGEGASCATPCSFATRSSGGPASYLWKKKYAGLGLNELRESRQLRDENAKLKRLVADLSLDRQVLQEIIAKKL